MFNNNGQKDVPYAIFMISMSFTAVALTVLIILGVTGVIGV